MRVALLCPYSLSRPGGVQGQVLGLARALRRRDHDVVVLAPVDRPVGDFAAMVAAGELTVLGGSIGLPGNGSVAPVSLTPAAFARTVRQVRQGGFDVVHLHEPFAPGPPYACLLAARPPIVGTFHRAGGSAFLPCPRPAGPAGGDRIAVRCAVSAEAEATARNAARRHVRDPRQRGGAERFATADLWPTDGPTVLFVGRHERRKGLGVLLDAFGRLDTAERDAVSPVPTLWVAGAGPDTASLRAATLPRPARVEWLGRIDDEELSGRLAAPTCVRALARG